MSFWSDSDYEVSPVPLDQDTADRLLAGAVAPEDAPPGYAGVARLLEAARVEPTAAEAASEPEIVATLARTVRSSRTTGSPPPRRGIKPLFSRRKVIPALVAVGLACTAGLASAGALPGPIQEFASHTLDKVGLAIPGQDDDAASSPTRHRESPDTLLRPREPGRIVAPARRVKRDVVQTRRAGSRSARRSNSRAGRHVSAPGAPVGTPSSSAPPSEAAPPTAKGAGVEKGAAISAEASNGKSRAGQVRPGARISRAKGTARSAEAKTSRDDAPKRSSDRDAARSQNPSSGAYGSGTPGGPDNGQQGGNPPNRNSGTGVGNGASGRSGHP